MNRFNEEMNSDKDRQLINIETKSNTNILLKIPGDRIKKYITQTLSKHGDHKNNTHYTEKGKKGNESEIINDTIRNFNN